MSSLYIQLAFEFPPARIRFERENFSDAFRKRFLAMHDHTCAYCGEYARGIDHFIPVVLGGTNDPSNLYPCCIRCNSTANAKLFDSFTEKQRHILRGRVHAGTLSVWDASARRGSHDFTTCVDCGEVYRYAADATIFLCPLCLFMDEHRPLPFWRRRRIDTFLSREFADGVLGKGRF